MNICETNDQMFQNVSLALGRLAVRNDTGRGRVPFGRMDNTCTAFAVLL